MWCMGVILGGSSDDKGEQVRPVACVWVVREGERRKV